MTFNQSIRNGNVRRDLEATLAVVLAADGFSERAIDRAGWERRGVLGRLVRLDGPADGILAIEAAAVTAVTRQAA